MNTQQSVDRVKEPSAKVVVREKGYLELKSAVGYWRAMHAKAI
ncbi:MAG: transposase, partial [Desulfobacteraceae bacterium]|nr:transposase [Desulfobacteraceae bacterium]